MTFWKGIHISNRPTEYKNCPGKNAAESPSLFRESPTIFQNRNTSGNKIFFSFIIQIQKDRKCGYLLLNAFLIPLEHVDSEDHVFLMWINPSLFRGQE